MREWTEQEEQEMIELAKQGDPRANYELSLWALRRSEEEPGEARWNSLAAKCLVKAAKAGYPPAQARVAELLHPSKEEAPPAKTRPEPAPPEPVRLSDARAAASRRSQGPAPETTARRPERWEPEPADGGQDEDGYESAPRPRKRGNVRPVYDQQDDEQYGDEYDGGYDGAPASGAFSGWGEKQWRRMEIICVAICAVLLIAIAVMIITSRGGISLPGSGSGGNVTSVIPPAENAGAAAASPSPLPKQYPDDDTRAAIQAAELDVYPEESDYVTMPTTATVKVNSQNLRLRTGPSTTYVPPICNMGDGATVEVYAIKNNWSLVYYEGGEDGPVYGWCSSEYLIVTSGAADSNVG